MKHILLLFFFILFSNQLLLAQSVTFNPGGTSALVDVKSTTNGLVIPRMNMSQRGALTLIPGLEVFCTDCSPAGPYMYDGTQWKAMFNIGTGTATLYTVGQQAQGGVVIWVDDSKQHGIVAAPQDVPVVELPIPYGIQPTPWQGFNEYDPAYSLAMGSGMYDGEKNTDMIMNRYGWGNYAAFRCRQMSFNKYGGWYLPSLNELFVMYENKHLLTGLTDNSSLGGFYWTSTEASTSAAYMVSFYNGFVTQMDKSKTNFDGYPTILFKIRAVRRF